MRALLVYPLEINIQRLEKPEKEYDELARIK